MRNSIISVIIPVYNVEKYLSRCIESVLNQTYRNLEILIVDDGSTDDSLNICRRYEKKDKRIKVIHQDNGGLSSARNKGLMNSTGEYISFVDSDDWLHPDFLAFLYGESLLSNSDIVECSIIETFSYDKYCVVDNYIHNRITFLGDDCFIEFIKGVYFKQTVWNKLYTRKVINNILFEYGKIHEDEFWTYRIFSRAKTVSFLNFKGYYYFQRDGSIMKKPFSEKNLDGYEAKCIRLNFIETNYANHIVRIEYINFLLSSIYFYYRIVYSNIKHKKYYLHEVKSNYNDVLKKVEFKNLNIKKKILFCSFYAFPKMYCRIHYGLSEVLKL